MELCPWLYTQLEFLEIYFVCSVKKEIKESNHQKIKMAIAWKAVGSNTQHSMSPVGPDEQQRATFESPDDVAAPVSPLSPPLEAKQFSNHGTATTKHATGDEINRALGNERFSTLEYDPVSTQGESMYNVHSRGPSDSIQWTHGHSRGPSGSSLPPYQQNADRFTTLPEALEPTKEEQEQRSSNEDTEANKRKVVAGGFMSKRVCRLEMKAVLIIAAILFFVTIGAVVGGVVASQKVKSNSKAIAAFDVAGAGFTTTSPPTTTSDSSSSSTTSSATRTSETATTTAPNGGFNGPYLPLRTQDVGYLDPDTDFFSPEAWQTITLSQSPLSITASYDPNIMIGSPNMAVTEVGEDSQHWQIRPVPPFWKNSTFETPTGWSRCYWIANRQFGPGVRLSQSLFDQNWKDLLRNRNSTTVYPSVQMNVANVHEEAQYWFFQRANLAVNGVQSKIPMYQMYNLAGSNEFRLAYNESWEDQPKMMSEVVWPKKMDWWDIELAGVVGSDDIPLGTTEKWITKVEEQTF